ncbi:MAG: fatty acid desaturase [Dehalococcoidia bacterium]
MSVAATSAVTLNDDYAELRRIIKAAGLLEDQRLYYTIKLASGLAMLAASVVIALVATHPGILLADAVFMAFASTQLALLAHDIIHRQAFRGRSENAITRLVVGNLLLGLSYSWWKQKHNQHHSNPNHIDKDPDIQLPMVVFSPEKLAATPRWLRPVIAFQAIILIILFPLQALLMRATSIHHLTRQQAPMRWLQLGLMAAHVALYGVFLFLIGGWVMALAFATVHQLLFGLYNSSVFASNHKGMPLTDDGKRLDFFREQVMTARDVDAHRMTDFWYGGLNYQIEHHLFPTMPRNNFPKAKPIIQQFCAERGVAFHSTSLAESYRESFGHLHRIGAAFRGGGAEA